MAGNWAKEWSDAKKTFEAKTERKKPPASVKKKFTGGTGLNSALKDCDKHFKAFGDAKPTDDKKKQAALASFEQSIVKFDTASNAYWKDIQTAMTKEKDKSIMAEMDILRKEIRAICDTMKAQAGMMQNSLEHLGVLEATAKNLMKSLSGACKRGLLFLAKARTDPSPEHWNSNVVKAARDITQQVGNVDKLLKKGKDIPGLPPRPEEAKRHFDVIKKWADSPKALTTPEQVKAERAEFIKAIQDVAKWMGM